MVRLPLVVDSEGHRHEKALGGAPAYVRSDGGVIPVAVY